MSVATVLTLSIVSGVLVTTSVTTTSNVLVGVVVGISTVAEGSGVLVGSSVAVAKGIMASDSFASRTSTRKPSLLNASAGLPATLPSIVNVFRKLATPFVLKLMEFKARTSH